MKIILTKDVPEIGLAGQLKEVADGYARNYLIPRGLAAAATNKSLKEHEAKQAVAKRHLDKAQAAHRALGDTIAKTELNFKVRVGEQHRLYGSITNADIADALSQKVGQRIDKHLVELEEPLKHLGTFKVPVRVAQLVTAEVTVTLEKEA